MATSQSVTTELAKFVVETKYTDLPQEAIDIAKRCIVDGTACMLAGSMEPASKILRQVAREIGGVGQAVMASADHNDIVLGGHSSPPRLLDWASGSVGWCTI